MWEIDRTVAPIAWNELEYNSKRKLRIGYVENDNFFAVSPGNRRAVNEAVKALEKQGHEVVRLCFPNFEKTRRPGAERQPQIFCARQRTGHLGAERPARMARPHGTPL